MQIKSIAILITLMLSWMLATAQNITFQQIENEKDICNSVSNLTAEVISINSVQMSWNATNALYYAIIRDQDTIANVVTTEYIDENVPFGMHYYCVISICEDGYSVPTCVSKEVVVPNCHAPLNFNVSVDYDNYETPVLIMNWNKVEEALYYNLYFDNELFMIEIFDTSFIFSGVANTEYCFKVTSFCEFSESAFSNQDCETIIAPEECTPPTVFVAALSFDGSQINLAWEPVFEAISYNIYRNGVLINEFIPNNSAVDHAIEPNNRYCYTVSSVCVDGESEQSEPECVDVVSVNEFETNFNIYPNPAKEVLFIESDFLIQKVLIFNVTGQLIYHSLHGEKSLSVNLSDWNSGLYFIRILTESGMITKKLIVQ